MTTTNLALQEVSGEAAVPQSLTMAEDLAPFVGESCWAQDTWKRIASLAPQQAMVGFVGEAGTGKTLLARHLHWTSERAPLPCTVIDLRRVPHEIIESELFGYARGGLLSRRDVSMGHVAHAGNGTCILQGLEQTPPGVQERCLSWLFEGSYRPVGTDDTVTTAARVVIEVRGRDLSQKRSTTLIRPIFDQLERTVVAVDPITKRRDDIVPIAEWYLQRYALDWGLPRPAFTHDAVRVLKRAPWKGNVRGILSAVAAALQEAQGGTVMAKHLSPALIGRPGAAAEIGIDATALEDIVEEKLRRFFSRLGEYEVHDLYNTVMAKVERPLFQLVLERTEGNQVKAARLLGINRNTLRTRLKKFGLFRKRS